MIKDELPGRPLSNPAGRNGVAEVLPPGQHAAEQAQRLPRAGGALQDAVDFLNGVSNEVTGQQGAALQTARPAETGPDRQRDRSAQAEPTRQGTAGNVTRLHRPLKASGYGLIPHRLANDVHSITQNSTVFLSLTSGALTR